MPAPSKEMKLKIKQVFEKLRRDYGLLARQNVLCCSSCAGAALTTLAEKRLAAGKVVNGLVFYHGQDHSRFRKGGNLMLRYSPADSATLGRLGRSKKWLAQKVTAALKEVGLRYEWDGNTGHCIEVPVQ